jgi:hypothetical protein
MDSIPYFLQLVSQNVVLSTMLISGSFSNLDLKTINYDILGKGIQIYNLPLNQNVILEDILFYSIEEVVKKKKKKTNNVIITMKNRFLFEHYQHYFITQIDTVNGMNLIPSSKTPQKIDFGFFWLKEKFNVPIHLIVFFGLEGNCTIYLTSYSNYKEVMKLWRIKREYLRASGLY